jgi:hypothetical protein
MALRLVHDNGDGEDERGERITDYATILDIHGKDNDHKRFVRMLNKIFGSDTITTALVQEFPKLPFSPEEVARCMATPGHPEPMNPPDKATCARSLRKIFLNKRMRLVVAQVIHSENPELPLLEARRQLKQLAAELRDLAAASRAGLIVTSDIRER